jgi:hypothetical protein
LILRVSIFGEAYYIRLKVSRRGNLWGTHSGKRFTVHGAGFKAKKKRDTERRAGCGGEKGQCLKFRNGAWYAVQGAREKRAEKRTAHGAPLSKGARIKEGRTTNGAGLTEPAEERKMAHGKRKKESRAARVAGVGNTMRAGWPRRRFRAPGRP